MLALCRTAGFARVELREVLGAGKALIRAAEEWARQQGYREFASDARLDNTTSQLAHQALGFIEVERAVLYRKLL